MNKNKRNILKGLAIGSVWTTPVISSVILPAHAETSQIVVSDGVYWGLSIAAEGIIFDPPGSGVHACIEVTNGVADVTFQGGNNNARRNGVVPTDGNRSFTTDVVASVNCQNAPPPVEIFIESISVESITLRVISRFANDQEPDAGFRIVVPEGSCGEFPELDGTCQPS